MGWLLVAIFALVSAGNLAIVYRWLVLKVHGSLVPLIGGVAGAAACILLPVDWLRRWWFVPLLVDPGSLPLMSITAVFAVGQLFKRLTKGD
ncbi:MAG: hypothetical protein U0R19_18785 [Bryobacteraceae bacterium]